MQNDVHDAPVHLGFSLDIESDSLYCLRSQYLPLGKIGGKPSWLNPKNIPVTSQLECKICKKAMCFLIQIYATKDDDPVHSFHRTLFVFVCRNPQCSKPNDSSNLKVFRCVLPRANPYYSDQNAMDPDLDGDVVDPYYPADAPSLCRICGCYASKKCAKCGVAWYCCRDHQALDWTTGHRENCGLAASVDSIVNPANPFVFKEFGIELDQEYVPSNIFDDLSDDEDDDGADSDDETDEERRRRLKEFQKFIDTQKGKNEDITVEDCEAAVEDQARDESFEKFNRLINLNPEQIIRYQRCGNPLKATDLAPSLPDDIPCCEICNGPRRFEFQLTPHLLSLIEVDSIGQSIDWASVYVYTCARSCEIPELGYAEEFVCKQDFK